MEYEDEEDTMMSAGNRFLVREEEPALPFQQQTPHPQLTKLSVSEE
jgi:hypothetical protein